ncbi:type IV secretory system conjugative DNA transfer family protein [Staphylococcus pseudintermedius]|uniref:Type VI secretion protein n=2 Tax=Staphylococcus pseudintermedius TaxID=283734 RepID=A0A8H9BZG5_STAPS|nr:type IV secretory system conjugative DNA transfer family protein [Staphylococcus pseudintermedius]EGQ0296387.1 type IV secretory system conjugative DNA transfer family protein [Staphylococcus pseudintermedius]EGQ0319651.1 type IV secretory system conjugative DNA transfer family protein [Staphylococcus pseudintermedius]EGQ0392278.1 type IV secretory system conjugative DNA transfer family protein [Staphylococcus pseudintermedius]EGQ1597532.1 type VI secretion protein [Staphylococcus pseudinter
MPIVKQNQQKTTSNKSDKRKLTFNKIKRRPFEFGELFTNRKSLMLLFSFTIFSTFLIVNTVLKIIFDIRQQQQNVNFLSKIDVAYEVIKLKLISILKNPFSMLHFEHFGYTLLIMLPLFLFISYKFYKMYRKYRNVDWGEEGDSRWTTLKELKEQYKEIPDTDEHYEGESGFPIAHYKNSYFIDTETHNNCIVGTSRSGKGESNVTVAIDIDARAEEKASLVIGDPKEELLNGSAKMLIEEGYRVLPLNIMNPDNSIAYNPLDLVKRQYLLGNYSKAEKYTGVLTNQIYFDPNAKDPFWNDSASNLIKAIILALLVQTDKNNELEKFTMYNVAKMLSSLGGNTDKNDNNLLDVYFKKLPTTHIAKDAYAQSNFSTGNTRGSIFTVAMGKLQIFLEQDIAKMTSASTLDLRRFGFKKIIDVSFDDRFRFCKGHYFFSNKDSENPENEVRTEIRSFDLDSCANIEIVFEEVLQGDTHIHFLIDDVDGKTYEAVYQLLIPKESKTKNTHDEIIEFVFLEELSQTKATFITGIYSNKPICLFLVVPDYDSSRNVIATLFISQAYTLLAEMTSNRNVVSNGKCHNLVKFRLDEFGNLPAIKDFEQILTVCAGRRIIFEAYVQSYAQFVSKYGDVNAKTIKENFQNHIYILTTDFDTAKEFSDKCGYFTTTKKAKNIQDGNTNVSYNLTSQKQALILPQDLLQIHESHTVVLRFTKRQDLKRNRIKAYPIFNQGVTSMPYRYEFLAHRINPAQKADIPEVSKHKYMNLADHLVTNFSSITLENEVKNEPILSEEVVGLLIAKLKEVYSNQNEDFSNYIRMNFENYCKEATSKEQIIDHIRKELEIDGEDLMKIIDILENDNEFNRDV